MAWLVNSSDYSRWLALAGSFVFSGCGTWLSIVYAKKRKLIDLPGQRRSHTEPTARGGGVGLAVSALVFFCIPFFADYPKQAVAISIALIAVAMIGWIDDHRPLSASVRLGVHITAASILFLLPAASWVSDWWGGFADPSSTAAVSTPAFALTTAAAIMLVVWSINLHNFMDGINGLLACQAVFVFIAVGIICGRAVPGDSQDMWRIWTLAAATAGFLPFNFPRARVFMGDVGSGTLGLLVAFAVVMQKQSFSTAVIYGLIICSAFVLDASCTLLSRMLARRRWYSAHREHLYQWLVRAGMSHAEVVACYMAWNLLAVVPILWWLNRAPVESLKALPASGYGWTIVLYALGIGVWFFGKKWCYSKVKHARHART